MSKDFNIVTLYKGEKFKVDHFPKTHFIFVVYGRLNIKWQEESQVVDQVFYVMDYLDYDRI